MLQKLKKTVRAMASCAILMTVTVGTALADCGGFDTGDLDKGTTGFLNVISGTPFVVGAAIALVAGVIAIFFDGGHVPQFFKVIIGTIIGVLLVLMAVGWLMSHAHCGTFTPS